MVGLLLGTGFWWRRSALVDVGVLSAALVGRAAIARRVARRRPDPAVWWGQPNGFSMPSRHTLTAVLGLRLLADRLATHRLAGQRVARGLGVAVGVSRVVLGLHWPTDVIAGYAFGVAAHKTSSRARGHTVLRG
jgi:undecaprenyl-diphosphatase